MIRLSLAEVADIVGGTIHDADGGVEVRGAAFLDSRSPVPSGLFAAFSGERVDGHEYAADAVRGGAAAVLGSRPTGVPTVVVTDVRSALQELAREVLSRLRSNGAGPQVVAITGSQGKTSAKDLLARVLADAAPTVATQGSFNNELGMPLTVLRADRATHYLVLEMGARGIGHLAELCRIAPPDISVVLNVGQAHLGEFGSRENIALAKGELVEALDAHGTAVLNADDPLVAPMASRTDATTMTFGTAAGADLRITGLDLDELGRASFELVASAASAPVRLRLLGLHQAFNAAAAAAAALAVGLELTDVAGSLSRVTALSKWRMEMHERADGLVVVNDAYNANPDSMRAALETLAELGRRSGRRTVAVLGEMLELGEESGAAHADIGRLVDELDIDEVVAVGAGAASIRGATTRQVESVEQAIAWLRHNVQRTDVVLVKASRGARLERVADSLLEIDGPDREEGEVGTP
ncbi:UDP-N-acetylmuramoyl-tripeptide--D-alanyl-D-alanine ligase [Nocardioides terrisoli]|uniref:UDP-N-acetylmuramoyl-tripeptide--D-alanyl-D- alanine ligase n=1 Tax=Nocardioides terrisoli TaxID=3388267 RepID=UPI00287BC31C|nr:UDP-N-acetylmuramoyl-tripeptide--D-alanyl-D-alanine ligase [Nocardioides marmorisolisilvae]